MPHILCTDKLLSHCIWSDVHWQLVCLFRNGFLHRFSLLAKSWNNKPMEQFTHSCWNISLRVYIFSQNLWSSGVWWSLLLGVRCLLHHNTTPYTRLLINVLAKYVDTIRILYYTHCPYSLLHNFMCHCIDHKLSALGVRKTDQTKLYVSTEDFSKKW